VKPTERIAKPASTLKAGSRAMLRVFLYGRGSGAPCAEATGASLCRCLLVSLAALATMLGALAFAAPVLAAAPEAPALELSARTAGSVSLRGVLSPNVVNEGGTYEILYKKSPSECKGGSHGTQGLALPEQGQPVEETISGLQPGTEYTFCLVDTNTAAPHEQASSTPPLTVTTAIKPEVPAAEKVKTGSITPSAAEVEGELNHLNAGEKGSYEFLYKKSETSVCTGESTVDGEALGHEKEVKTAKLENLQPNAEYAFCLSAHNEAGEEATGAPVTFTTSVAPPEIVAVKREERESTLCPFGKQVAAMQGAILCEFSESTSEVKSTSAKLEARVNANNQKTTYQFEYATNEAISENVVKPTGGSLPAEYNPAGTAVVTATGVLAQGTTYYYRVAVENAAHEKAVSNVEHFTTVPTANTDAVSELSASTVMFHGHLTLSAVGSRYFFDYKAHSTSACEESSTTAVPAGTGSATVSASTQVTGLAPGTEYGVCLVTANASGSEVGPVVSFKTPAVGPPAVIARSESATEVAGDSVTLGAEIDPNGAETSYSFEYGTSTAYGQSTPSATLSAADDSAHPVTVHVQNLQPDTVYHYRVVASNEVGGKANTVAGSDQTFTTEGTGGEFVLPDSRQWEMVSPVAKHGALLYGLTGLYGLVVASTDGDALTYVSSQPMENEPRGYTDTRTQNLATRGSGGWQSRGLTVPHVKGAGESIGFGDEYRFFSSDLSHAILQPFGTFTPCRSSEGVAQPCISPEASESTAFLETDYLNGNVNEPCLPKSMACNRPLVTGCPKVGECPASIAENANVTPGTVFGGDYGGEDGLPTSAGGYYKCTASIPCGPIFLGGTPDLSHMVFRAEAQLTPEAPSASPSNLWEWSAGKLAFVGEGSLGGGDAEASRHAISNDGSRIVIDGSYGGLGGLLMRDMTTGETVDLSAGLGLGGGLPYPFSEHDEPPKFQGANAEGSRVFFTEAGELYVFEVTEGSVPLAGRVRDLTNGLGLASPAAGNAGEGSREILGVSEDGSYVYFVSNGVLPGSGATSAGDNNLYVDHYDGSNWTPTFIAALSDQDHLGAWATFFAGLGSLTARVSPNGDWLAFMSDAELTGYDNRDAVSGRPDAEVYLYSAATKRLVCASCDPTGARPIGVPYEDLKLAGQPGGGSGQEEALVAANVPGWESSFNIGTHESSHQPRYLSDSGRLFFDSGEALVPQDVNGTEDVYEYEPEGVGGCTSATSSGSSLYEPARAFEVEGRSGQSGAGCVGLISSGSSAEESEFLDASESGGDVFFVTKDKLVPQDVEGSFSIYDAHECTSQAPCVTAPVSPPECDTEASCKAAPTPQPEIYGAPPSATFVGPGNLAPPLPSAPAKVTKKTVKCKKGFAKDKQGKCVKAKKKKKSKKAKKASYERRIKS
jgi:hypothetical protein